MTILVTGSAGHLGEALMRTLRGQGRPAIGLDIRRSSFTDCVGSAADRDVVRRCLAGVRSVIHAAALHKPHIATHGDQDFIDTNITATRVLLEEAVSAGLSSFVFTSTTGAFGLALTPAPDEPAVWVTEDVPPIARNIYGETKLRAEGLCEQFSRNHRLPVIVLRTSRFFPEADDDPAVRAGYEIENAQANEFLHRRLDLEDLVTAHFLAVERAPSIGFGRFVVSATTPFGQADLLALRRDAASVVHRLFPDCAQLYASRGWRLYPAIDRVYVNHQAVAALKWRPKYDFRHVLNCLRAGQDFRSPLARDVGSKGYHGEAFHGGPADLDHGQDAGMNSLD